MIRFTKVKKPFGWLSNMAWFPIHLGGVTYPTSEYLFQIMRFKNPSEVRARLLIENQRNLKSECKRLAKKYERFDTLDEQDINRMKFCVFLKLLNNPQLIRDLLSIGDEEIIEDVSKRTKWVNSSTLFWGKALVGENNPKSGMTPYWVGLNTLGVIWMEINTWIGECPKDDLTDEETKLLNRLGVETPLEGEYATEIQRLVCAMEPTFQGGLANTIERYLKHLGVDDPKE